MPDYNPAVAAGFQPQQQNVLGTLEGISQLQIGQAHAGLYSLQQQLQQRKLNGLAAATAAYQAGQDPVAAGLNAGLDPQDATAFQGLVGTRTFMQGHGGLSPQGAEASANIGRIGAETRNLNLQAPGIAAESQTKIQGMNEADRKTLAARSVSLYNDPSPENAQDMLDDHSMHMTPLNRGRLQMAVKNGDTDAIRGMAADMQSAVMTPEERANLVQPGTTAGSSAPQLRLRTPQEQEVNKAFAAQTAGNIKAANEKATAASQAQSGILQLRNDLIKLPQNSGFLTPGEGAGKRAAIAKAVNSALTTSGFQPIFDQGQVAAAEAAQKGTVRMGFDLAKTLGSREAAMIVQQSVGVQPGISQTPEGNRRIMASLLVAQQRDRDYAQFLRGYDKGAIPGEADEAFNRQHPVSGYVDDVEKIMSLEQKRDDKGESPIDRLVQNPGSAGKFDKAFGGNLSRYFGNPAQ